MGSRAVDSIQVKVCSCYSPGSYTKDVGLKINQVWVFYRSPPHCQERMDQSPSFFASFGYVLQYFLSDVERVMAFPLSQNTVNRSQNYRI
jgi:hypothetical protein